MEYSAYIEESFANDKELARLLPLIDNVAIIEYDGTDVSGSVSFACYLLKNKLDSTIVKRVVVCGRKKQEITKNKSILENLYPSAEISFTRKEWKDSDFKSFNIRNTLVLHMAASIHTHGINNVVNETRSAYCSCLFEKGEKKLFESPVLVESRLRLNDFVFSFNGLNKALTSFCSERQDYIDTCFKTITPKDTFFQCMDEVEQGCEECNQCSRYGKSKKCPFAQRMIARFYRQGQVVTQNEEIAHQWDLMAAKQGYKPAEIQVADDLRDGVGCEMDLEKACSIYSYYARMEQDEYCMEQILDIAKNNGVEKVQAIPYIAFAAKMGNEDMIMILSDAFQRGDWGLPKDMVQQREWIEQGAENGNPRFMKAMAEMYEVNKKWEDSYKWYKRLNAVDANLVSAEKLEEIEMKMMTGGATVEEIASKGIDYLFGYNGTGIDTHLAFRYLKYASDSGVALAKGQLGRMYDKGIEVKKNRVRAITLLIEASDNGDLLSMDRLKDIYYETKNPRIDIVRLENRLRKRIEERMKVADPIAFYLKAKYHMSGYLFEEDEGEASRYMRRAALVGFPLAQYELAMMYKVGLGVTYDWAVYRKWIEQASSKGYYKAKGEYGVLLFNDWRRTSAFPLLRDAYEQGYHEEQVEWSLAQCYMNGSGTAQNKAKAYPMYKDAAEKGNVHAQAKLCQDYFRGNNDLPKDYKECVRWGEEALMRGDESVKFYVAYASASLGKRDRAYKLYLELADNGNVAAMNNLGCLEREEKKAAEWFLKAAEKGDEVAQKNIARYYRYGIAVEKDTVKAFDYYKKSADQGYLEAIIEMANMYRYGDCVEKDELEAVKWYEKAVAKGHTQSMIELASIYQKGGFVKKDIDKAIHYYKLAAEKDDVNALIQLGNMYITGYDVERDDNKAIYWYRKAAAKGNQQAKEKLKQLGVNWIEKGQLEEQLGDKGYEDDDLPF